MMHDFQADDLSKYDVQEKKYKCYIDFDTILCMSDISLGIKCRNNNEENTNRTQTVFQFIQE